MSDSAIMERPAPQGITQLLAQVGDLNGGSGGGGRSPRRRGCRGGGRGGASGGVRPPGGVG